MFKKILLATVLLMFCCSVLAQEENDGEDPKPKKTKRVRKPRTPKAKTGFVAPAPLVESSLVLSRLGLNEEQLAKAKSLDGELAKKFEELKAEAGKDRKKKAEALKTLQTLVQESTTKIVALLNEEQKKKYEEGARIIAEHDAGMKEAQAENAKARKAAGKDKNARAEAVKAFKTKQQELTTTRDKALDEKVGKKPAA